MIDFSQNVNALGVPAGTVELIRDCKESMLTNYPDARGEGVGAAAVASMLGVPGESVALGLGATEVLAGFPQLLDGKRAVVPVPTFWQYEFFCKRRGIEVVKLQYAEAKNFALDVEKIDRQVKPGDIVFLCNINNPTSVRLNSNHIKELALKHKDVHFVVDETYLLFCSNFGTASLVSDATTLDNLHVAISLSKFFSIPGIRVGCLISDADTVNTYKTRVHLPYSISALSQTTTAHVCADRAFIAQTRAFYAGQRERLYAILTQRFSSRVKFFKPDGNFILGKLLVGVGSKALAAEFGAQGIRIRGGHELTDLNEAWFRCSIRSDEDNQQFVAALEQCLGS